MNLMLSSKKVTSLKDCQVQTKIMAVTPYTLDVNIKNICSIEGVTNNTEGRSVCQKIDFLKLLDLAGWRAVQYVCC